jgi:hypothetical protein
MNVKIGAMYVPKYNPPSMDPDMLAVQEALLDKRPTPCLLVRLAIKFWRWA